MRSGIGVSSRTSAPTKKPLVGEPRDAGGERSLAIDEAHGRAEAAVFGDERAVDGGVVAQPGDRPRTSP